MEEAALLADICRTWGEVLELPAEQVQANSHFLQLGGDSLHWTRMVLRIQEVWGLALPVHPQSALATPARLAGYCRQQLLLSEPPVVTGAELPESSGASFPATVIQRGLWFAEQLAGKGSLYQNAVLLHFSGRLDTDRLRAAFWQLLEDVPILRANFNWDTHTRRLCCSYRLLPATLDTDLLPCRELAIEALPAAVDEAVALPLTLERDSLCRALLFRSGAHSWHLLLLAHHLVCDGWSGDLLLRRLAATYRGAPTVADHGFAAYARQAGQPGDGPARLGPDGAGSDKPDLHESDLDKLAWWRSQLEGLEASQRWLWGEQQQTAPWPHAVAQRYLPLSAALCARCGASALRAGVSFFMLCQTACKQALWRLSGVESQVLAIPCALRSAAEEEAIGCFVAVQLSVSRQLREADSKLVLQEEDRQFRQARATGLALQELNAALKPATLPDGNPWSSVLLAFQNFPHFGMAWPALACRLERVAARQSQFALCLEFVPAGEGWCLRLEYARELFNAERLAQLESALLLSFEQLAD